MSRGYRVRLPEPTWRNATTRVSSSDAMAMDVGLLEILPEAAMVARGLLADEYGVLPQDLQWVQAGLEQIGREDKIHFQPPAGVSIEKVNDRTIVELFERGEVDAMISPRAPRTFDPAGTGPIRRMFPEPGPVEAACRSLCWSAACPGPQPTMCPMTTSRYAWGFGLTTVTMDGTTLDAWYPDPQLGGHDEPPIPAEFEAMRSEDPVDDRSRP